MVGVENTPRAPHPAPSAGKPFWVEVDGAGRVSQLMLSEPFLSTGQDVSPRGQEGGGDQGAQAGSKDRKELRRQVPGLSL